MVSDVINFNMIVKRSRPDLWRILGDPENFPRFFRGIGTCVQIGEPGGNQFAAVTRRGPVRFHLDLRERESELIIDGLDNDWIGSFRFTEPEPGRTRIAATFFKISHVQRWLGTATNSDVTGWIRDGLRAVVDCLTEAPTALLGDESDPRARQLAMARTMIDAGVVQARRPDRALRQLDAMADWGFDLPGGYRGAATESPREIALVDDGGTRTYTELNERTTRLATALAGHRIGPGKAIAVLGRNRAATVEAIVATARTGADALLFDTSWDAERIARVGAQFPLAAVFVDEEFEANVAGLPADVLRIATLPNATVGTGQVLDELIAGAAGPAPAPQRPGRKILFTPRTGAARISAPPRSFAEIAAPLSRLPLQSGDRMLVGAPLYRHWGLTALRLAMPLRARLVLRDRFEAESCLRAVDTQRCTVLIATPEMLQEILDLPTDVRGCYDTSSLRVIASAGGPLPGDLAGRTMDAFGEVLYNVYGTSESSWVTVAGPADLRLAPHTAGQIVLGAALAIRDASGATVARGATGRIAIDNEPLAGSNGELHTTAGRYVETGDLGYVDADDLLFVTGRTPLGPAHPD